MKRRLRKQARGGRPPTWISAAIWAVVLLASLLLVSWRQTVGLEMERELRALQSERDILEAERVEYARRVEELRSRSRVLRVARERLGMRLPEPHEIVFLPVASPGAARPEVEP